MAIWPTGGPFPNLPHHLDLASEDTVGHSTCMSVLARRRAIMGSIVQPKRSCLRAVTAGGVVGVFWYVRANSQTYQKTPTTRPAVAARRHDCLGCTIDPMKANPNPNTPIHVL